MKRALVPLLIALAYSSAADAAKGGNKQTYFCVGNSADASASLDGIIGDPRFSTRDRMGCDLAFLCRVAANGWLSAPRGISVDEQTALLVDGGDASVVGYAVTVEGGVLTSNQSGGSPN